MFSGSEFESIVERFSKIQNEIEGKKWALKELNSNWIICRLKIIIVSSKIKEKHHLSCQNLNLYLMLFSQAYLTIRAVEAVGVTSPVQFCCPVFHHGEKMNSWIKYIWLRDSFSVSSLVSYQTEIVVPEQLLFFAMQWAVV